MKTRGRPLPRSFIIIVFGPLVGAMAVFLYAILAGIIEGTPLPTDPGLFLFYALFLVLAFGWLAGLLPAILSALAWKFVAPRVAGWRRVAAALATGAIASMVAGWPIFVLYFPATQVTPQGTAVLGVIGAIAMAATALPGDKS
jgi:hypothetical protein